MKSRPGQSAPFRARSLVLLVVTALAALAPLPRWAIERWYSNGFYAAIQPAITFVSNNVPFALFDALLISVSAAFVVIGARDLFGSSKLRGTARILARTAVWGAALYLALLVVWGFNYRRERLADRLPFDASAVNQAAVARLASAAVERLNALHPLAHAEGWTRASVVDPSLAGAFERVLRLTGASGRVVAGRPKHTIFDWYFRRAGVSGMIDPYFLESLVAGDLLPVERPFVIAHEWGHLAGLADEGEANVVGWFVCLQATPASQYSGWLFMTRRRSARCPPPTAWPWHPASALVRAPTCVPSAIASRPV